MKNILIIFIILLHALITDSFAYGSQVMKAGFVLQNAAADSATVAIFFYYPDGSQAHQITQTLDGYSSSLIDLDDVDELTPGWSGSAVIFSDQGLVGAGCAETFSKYGDPEGIGCYNLPGSNAVDTIVSVPLILNDPANGFRFNLWIQNAGSSTASVTVTYYASEGGNFYNSTCPDLTPGASLDSINACSSNLPDSFVGSAVVSSNQPIAVVANQLNPTNMTECVYNGIPGSAGDKELFFPIVLNNYYGWYSSFTVQNIGTIQTQGDFDYHKDNCNTCEWSTLSSSPINPLFGYMFTPLTSSFTGYGKFTTAGEPFGSVARIWNNSARAGYCYNGFAGGGSSYPVPEESIWYIPWVNGDSRILVKNTNGSTGGTINVNWRGLSEQQTVELSANDKKIITPAIPEGWSGSAVIQATGSNLPLAIVVQNSQPGGNDSGTYESYSNNKGASTLYVPQVSKAPQFQLPPPDSFSKSSPAYDATEQPLDISLNWGSSTNATSYEYCIDSSNNSSCDSSWISVGSNTSAITSGLGPSSTYYWQVRAINSVSNTEANDNTWWPFTTTGIFPWTMFLPAIITNAKQ